MATRAVELLQGQPEILSKLALLVVGLVGEGIAGVAFAVEVELVVRGVDAVVDGVAPLVAVPVSVVVAGVADAVTVGVELLRQPPQPVRA